MTLVENINVPPEYLELWKKSCIIRSGYFGDKVDAKFVQWRKRNFASLIARGQFQGLADQWNALTLAQQTAWDNAGGVIAMSGFALFAQDTLYRFGNNLIGLATPSTYHQFKVGKITLGNDGDNFLLVQDHAGRYELAISGETYPETFSLASIIEVPTFIFTYGLSIKLDLTEVVAGGKFRLGVVLRGTIGGLPDSVSYYIEMPLSRSWVHWEWDFDEGWDTLDSYEINFHGWDVKGTVHFDRVVCKYNDTNFAIDPNCDNVEGNYSGSVAGCRKPFAKENFPSGNTLESVYISS